MRLPGLIQSAGPAGEMALLRWVLVVALTSLGSLAGPSAWSEAQVVQEFSLRETFGVSHPMQLVDFELAQSIDPRSTSLTDAQGSEAPYQVLRDGRIAIRADLPPYAERTWKLHAGKAPTPVQGGVQMTAHDRYYEITNGMTGVRVPVPSESPSETLAPIQGIRARSGRWMATGPNVLSPPARHMQVAFRESGPLKVVVEVSYAYDRPAYQHRGKGLPPEGILFPAGQGYYRSTIEVQAGQPSIIIEEETDMDVSYALDVYDALRPDQARYRGHHARSKEAGYEANGQQYRPSHMRSAMDAFVDLAYESSKTYPPMAVWDPWIFDSGWYWQLYNAQAPGTADQLGIFAGRPTRAIGAASSGVSVFSRPTADLQGRAAGLGIACKRLNPDGRYFPRVRFAWGLFSATKDEALKPPTQVQPIARQMNLHAGINLNKIHRFVLAYSDPTHGYGALFMDRSILARKIQRLREDRGGPHGSGYYGYLYKAEPTSRDLFDMWADSSGRKTAFTATVITDLARDLLNALIHGDGIYDFRFHYWHGGLEMMRKGLWIDSVLAQDFLTAEDRARVKATAALFGNVLWDNDFVPLFSGHGLNLGTENMPVQQWEYRNFYALLLTEHPLMHARAEAVEQQTRTALRRIVNDHGAEIGSTHYIGASFIPLLNSLLQIRMLGGADPFAAEPRLARFAEFFMHFLTPPEVRFGGPRKLISVGDSSSESSAIYGQLATGFATASPELSARLMGAWHAVGKLHSGFFGSSVLMIDEEAPAKDPMLGNATFPGWYSVLRYGWGTENETAVWLINGDFYRDHRHHDQGSVVIYALGAPLSIDWGSMYSPHVPGGFMHSVVLPEAGIGIPWDRDGPPLDAGAVWKESRQEVFLSFKTAASARARFTSEKGMVWTRSVSSLHANEDYPIILVHDQLSAANAEVSQVLSFNFMAEGPVETTAGPFSPPARSFQHNRELPSARTVFSLRPGVSRLAFTGQWLIDWDVYTVADRRQEAQIGNWAHTWHPGHEQHEFERANRRRFEERQHILRLKGDGPSKLLILPYRKGRQRDDLQVTQKGERVTVRAGDETTVVADSFYAYRSSSKRVLATFKEGTTEVEGIRIVGGPVEIVVEHEQVHMTAAGEPGIRRIRLPGLWSIKGWQRMHVPLSYAGEDWVLSFSGGTPATVTLEKS